MKNRGLHYSFSIPQKDTLGKERGFGEGGSSIIRTLTHKIEQGKINAIQGDLPRLTKCLKVYKVRNTILPRK